MRSPTSRQTTSPPRRKARNAGSSVCRSRCTQHANVQCATPVTGSGILSSKSRCRHLSAAAHGGSEIPAFRQRNHIEGTRDIILSRLYFMSSFWDRLPPSRRAGSTKTDARPAERDAGFFVRRHQKPQATRMGNRTNRRGALRSTTTDRRFERAHIFASIARFAFVALLLTRGAFGEVSVATSGTFTAAYLELVPELERLANDKVVTAATCLLPHRSGHPRSAARRIRNSSVPPAQSYRRNSRYHP